MALLLLQTSVEACPHGRWFAGRSLRLPFASAFLRLDASRRGGAVAGGCRHLGNTVETVSRTCAHWLRDDRDLAGAMLDRVLAPIMDGTAERLMTN